MRRPSARLLFAVPTAAVALVAAAGVAVSQEPQVRLVAAVGPYTAPHDGVVVNAGVTGEARIGQRDKRSVVSLAVRGLAPRTEYGVHVHVGRCSDFGPHYRYDAAGAGVRSNEVWLDLSSNSGGLAHDRVKVPTVPTDAAYSIVVHAASNPDRAPAGEPGHPGARIACGDFAAE